VVMLGTGHVKYFYDKQLYLLQRYKEIYQELILQQIKSIDTKELSDLNLDYADTISIKEVETWLPDNSIVTGVL